MAETEQEKWARWNAQADRLAKAERAQIAKEKADAARAAEKEAERQAKATKFLEPGRAAEADASVASARRAREEAEATASTAAEVAAPPKKTPASSAGSDGGGGQVEMDLGTSMRGRGYGDINTGAGLIAEAGRTVKVTKANPTFGAVKGYTDTMGSDAQREGRFKGVRDVGQVAEAVAPAQPAQAPAPVQVVVQTPQAAPASPAPAAPAPARSGTPVPASALPKGAPGQAVVPDAAVPMEGDADVVAQDQAQLEQRLASMTPEEQKAWLDAEGARLDQQASAAPASGQGDFQGAPSGVPEAAKPKGVLQRQMNAAEDLSQAKVDMAQAEADAMTESAAQYDQALADQRKAEDGEKARVQAQLDARKQADTEIAGATKAFGEQQTLSPDKAWSNMASGRKVAFAIGALASGLRGSSDPLATVRNAVSMEVDAQAAKIAKLGSNLDAARSRGDSAEAVYANVLQQVGDERQARSITEVARLNQIKANFEARLARDGTKVLSAEQEAFLTGLEGEIAGKQMQIDVQAAKNPRTITSSVNVYNKGQRDAMKATGKALVDAGGKAIASGDDFTGKSALQGQELTFKAGENAQKQAATREDKIYGELGAFADKTEVAQQVVGLIDGLLVRDDIAGYGVTAGPTVGNAANNVEADIGTIAEAFGRLQSQGVISPDEEVRFMAMLKDGTTLGGEKRLRQNLTRIKGMVNLRITAQERRLSKPARDYYNKNKNNAEIAARWSGGAGETVVQEDE